MKDSQKCTVHVEFEDLFKGMDVLDNVKEEGSTKVMEQF